MFRLRPGLFFVTQDDLDSETSESTPHHGPGSNPLFALKELCNNTCSPRRGPVKSDSPSLSTSSVSSTSSPPPPRPHSDQNGNINEGIKADDDLVKCSIDSVQSSEENEIENAEKKMARCTAGKSPELIRVKKDSELLRSARSSRRSKNKTLQSDETKTQSGNVAAANNAASQSTTEAKFFRYSELAKVLAAGN